MKKYFTLAVCLLFTTLAVGQEVSTQQYSFLAKKTADWCPKCGDYGWTFFKSIFDANQDRNVIQLALHYSGGLSDPTASEISANYGGGGQPLFWINDEEIVVLPNTVSTNVTNAQSIINSHQVFNPQIGIGIDAKYADNKLTIKAKAKALTDTDALDYYFGVYLVRNHLIAPQSSQGNMADHINVLDRKATSDHFGDRIFDVLSKEDSEYDFETTLNNVVPHSQNIEDLKVVAIMWSKDTDGKYHFVNGYIVSAEEATSAVTDDLDNTLSFDLVPNGNTVNIAFLNEVSGKVDAKMYDLSGKLVQSNLQKISNKIYTLEVNEPSNGIYFTRVSVDNKVVTKQVLITN